MKLVINGIEYDASAQPFIGDLRLLKKELGFGWGTVAKRLESLDENADWAALLDDSDFIEALMAWVWMSRRRAGERNLTLTDVEETPIDQIEWRAEPGDEQAAVDDAVPTSAQRDSALGDADAPPPTSTKPSTKTSKKPSTRG